MVLISKEVLGEVTCSKATNHDITLTLRQFASLANDLPSFESNDPDHASLSILVCTSRFSPETLVLQLLLDLPKKRLVLLMGVLSADNELV